MSFLYNTIFFLFLIVSIPKTLKRLITTPEYRGMLFKRMFCPTLAESRSHPRIWLNGVSVGEVASLQPLVWELERKYPGIQLVISCTTGTGFKRAKSLYPDHAIIGYPFDFSMIANRFIKKIRPSVFISVELDMWPNFMLACQNRNVPYVVVSGRLSEKSTAGYEKVKMFLSAPFESITLFLAQDQMDADRALRIGIPEERIKVGGNLKFDLLVRGVRKDVDFGEMFSNTEIKTLVFASTHDPEERELLTVLEELEFFEKNPAWRVIIVPRHPERTEELIRLVQEKNRAVVKYSQWQKETPLQREILLVDQIGILSSLYNHCDLCFVGGSLIPHGGQNMIEPAALGVAVLFGPHVQNFREASKLLLDAQAVVQVQSLKELAENLQTYLASSDKRLKLGQKAASVIQSKKGIATKVVKEIEYLLEG